jgi:tetratricopeptide (TPR) repeat protein
MAEQPKPKPAHDTPEDHKPGRFASLRARLPNWSRRTKITVLIVVLLVAAHGVALWVWLPRYLGPGPKQRFNMAMALAALDRHSLAEARHAATMLQSQNSLDESERGGPAFILGAIAAEEAELAPPTERRGAYQSAAKLLGEARQRGFPRTRQAQGLFLLGKSLFLAGAFAASRAPLEEAVHADSNLAGETDVLLASAYSQGADPDFVKAREYSERSLANRSLSSEDRNHAQLLNAEILEKLNDPAGCRAALAQIPAESESFPGAVELEAELLMREAHSALEQSGDRTDARAAANARYQQAIENLKLVESNGKATATLDLRAKYLTAICWLESENLPAAQEQFERVLLAGGAGDETVAAAFQIANLLRRQGRNDEALAMYRRVVKAIGDPLAYHNDLLSVVDVRKQMLIAYEQFLNKSQIDEALQLSQLMHPLFPSERELELSGELYRSAANSYLSKASTADPEQGKILSAKARLNFRMAGLAFSKLAELHTTARSYSDDLWNAAQCFEQGHDYQHATKTSQVYLKNELRRRGEGALLMLGEAQLTLGETDKALSALEECVEGYPNDPASSLARLLMARAFEEKGDLAKAEPLLRANLDGGLLNPRSTEWRDSLFALAKLLASAGRFQEAIPRLEEALSRYPNSDQVVETKYLTAECYRRLGLQAEQKLAEDTIDAAKLLHQKQMQENMTAAVDRFQQLVTTLSHEKSSDANPLEKSILRNCYFALGLSLVDLNRLDDAIGVYSAIANLRRNEPEVLEALVQTANCYRKLDRLVEARGAIAQAKVALDRLNKDTDFTLTTNYSRDEWRQMLEREAAL